MKNSWIKTHFKNKIINEKCFVFLFAFFLLFLLYNCFTPIYMDDYSYMYSFATKERITSLFDIFPSMSAHYYLLNGRLVLHFLSQVFLLLGKGFFNVFNSFAFCYLIILIYYHATGTIRKISSFTLIFIFLFLFLFIPAFGESFLWLDGASNYLHGIIICLSFLIPYRRLCDEKTDYSKRKTLFSCLVMFVFGLLAGDSLENMGVTVVFTVSVYIFYRIVKYKKVQFWAVSGLIGSCIGCFFMLASPGSRNRTDDLGLNIKSTVHRGISNTAKFVNNYSALLIAFLLFFLIWVFLYRQQNNMKLFEFIKASRFIVIYFLMFIVSFYAFLLSPWMPNRVWSTFLVLFLILFINVVRNCFLLFSDSQQRIISLAVVIVMSVCFSFNYVYNFVSQGGILSVYRDFLNREQVIETAKQDGIKDVYIESIDTYNKYSCYSNDYGVGDLSIDYNEWPNTALARYYCVDSIRKK